MSDRYRVKKPRPGRDGSNKPRVSLVYAQMTAERCAAANGIDVARIFNRSRNKRVVWARRDIALHLFPLGASTVFLANFLNVDSSTVSYYLGHHGSRGIAKIKWRAPQIRDETPAELRKPERPSRSRQYLIPYAGADWSEYEWKERPSSGA